MGYVHCRIDSRLNQCTASDYFIAYGVESPAQWNGISLFHQSKSKAQTICQAAQADSSRRARPPHTNRFSVLSLSTSPSLSRSRIHQRETEGRKLLNNLTHFMGRFGRPGKAAVRGALGKLIKFKFHSTLKWELTELPSHNQVNALSPASVAQEMLSLSHTLLGICLGSLSKQSQIVNN